MGRLAKTDRIDAGMLAELAAVLVRRDDLARYLRPLPDARQQTLAAVVTRRRQLLTVLGAERQRLQLAIPMVRPSMEAMHSSCSLCLGEPAPEPLVRRPLTWTADLLPCLTAIRLSRDQSVELLRCRQSNHSAHPAWRACAGLR